MKILVVDDEDLVRNLAREVINYYFNNTDIIMADSGENGWKKFQDTRPDLVITDVWMEEENSGLMLAKKIKAESPETPVIIMTGTPPEKMPEAVDRTIEKPFKIDKLADLIKDLIKKPS